MSGQQDGMERKAQWGADKPDCKMIEARAFITAPVRSAILRVRIFSPAL